MLEKARAKNKKPKSSAGISSIPNITVGTQVKWQQLKYIYFSLFTCACFASPGVEIFPLLVFLVRVQAQHFTKTMLLA